MVKGYFLFVCIWFRLRFIWKNNFVLRMCSWACCSSCQVKVYFDRKVIPKKEELNKMEGKIHGNGPKCTMLGLLSSLVISMVNTAQLRLRAGLYLVVHAQNTFHRFYSFYWEGGLKVCKLLTFAKWFQFVYLGNSICSVQR